MSQGVYCGHADIVNKHCIAQASMVQARREQNAAAAEIVGVAVSSEFRWHMAEASHHCLVLFLS